MMNPKLNQRSLYTFIHRLVLLVKCFAFLSQHKSGRTDFFLFIGQLPRRKESEWDHFHLLMIQFQPKAHLLFQTATLKSGRWQYREWLALSIQSQGTS